MADVIRARDLMRTEFLSIRTEQSLGDAMTSLLETQRQAKLPSALMIVDSDGNYQGMLTARALIRLLVEAGEDRGEEQGRSVASVSPDAPDDLALLCVARERLLWRVADVLLAGLPVVAPVVAPDDRLLTMIRRGVTMRFDFVPVVDAGKPVGFAPITAIFQAAAGIALTPEDEGVRFDR